MPTNKIFSRSFTRDFPEFEPFYKNLADIGAIFWAFYSQRLSEGVPFTLDDNSEDVRQFDLERYLTEMKNSEGTTSKIVYQFVEGTRISIILSLYQFFQEMGYKIPGLEGELPLPPISDNCRMLLGEYTRNLIDKTQMQGEDIERKNLWKQVGRGETDPFTVVGDLEAGFNSATLMTTQTLALFGKGFKREYVSWLAKLPMRGLSHFLKKIGVGDAEKFYDPVEEPDFSLLHATEGYDIKQLLDQGMGKGLGCIAFMPPSPATKQFLQTAGVGETISDHLGFRFIARTRDEFNRTIALPYEGLTEELKSLIDPLQRNILEGKVIQGSQEGNVHPHGWNA